MESPDFANENGYQPSTDDKGKERNGDVSDETQQQQQQQPQNGQQEDQSALTRSENGQPEDATDNQNTTKTTHFPELVNEDEFLGDRLARLDTHLQEELSELRCKHFKDYEHIERLNALADHTKMLCSEYQERMGVMLKRITEVRETTGDIRATMDRKIEQEGLSSWLRGPGAYETDKEAIADEKALLAKAAEARSVAGKACTETSRLEELSATLEADASDALRDAAIASREAAEAARIAQEAKRAEEAKREAAERARAQEEEERVRREAEERRRKEEEEKRRARQDRFLQDPEEREKRNPKNWPVFVYSVDPGAIDIPIGCIVRSFPGSMDRGAIDTNRLEQVDSRWKTLLGDYEELVSHVIEIRQTDTETDIQLEEPLAVAIPHCAPRNTPSREPVIKILQQDGRWSELPTYEVVFDDIKEYKFVEVRLRQTKATLVVVTRYKREQFTLGKRGGKLFPAVDSRICLAIKAGTFKVNTSLSLEIHPIELSAVSDLRYRHPDDCHGLLAASGIVNLGLLNRRLGGKPVSVTLPVPPNPQKRHRPATAVDRTASSQDGTDGAPKPRPASAILGLVKKDAPPDDCLHLLKYQESNNHWINLPDVTLQQAKNKDNVTFEMVDVPLNKFMILRTKPGVSGAKAEQMAAMLEKSLKQRMVQLILRQRNEDASDVILQCVNLQKSERIQRKLTEDGYDDGPAPSAELSMREGQEMTLRFRGNIADIAVEEHTMVFNSHIRTKLDFFVKEIDKFAQKGIDCYRGFAQVYTRGLVPRQVRIEVEDSRAPAKVQTVWEEDDILLSEMLVSLPKPEPEAPQPIVTRAPVQFKADGVVDNDLLQHLSAEIGDEWKKLAQLLSIRRVRIQAILRNNVNNSTEHAVYDMLTTWAKRVPRSINKVDVLCTALQSVGRVDLVEELRDKEEDHRIMRARNARDSHLRRAFVKVAQNEHICSDWKYLARQMGLAENDLNEIEAQSSSKRERCHISLLKWREIRAAHASVESLVKHLKRCRYHHVADNVQNHLYV